MNVLQLSEKMNSSEDLQVWNNAAFNNGDSEQSWGSLKSVFGNPNASLDSVVLGKENQCPTLENHIRGVSPSNKPFKPVNRDASVEKSRIKEVSNKAFLDENIVTKQKGFRDEKKIDKEIEEIESEISRLSTRLESLKLEKNSLNTVEKRGKIVSAKFMEPEKKKNQRRGVSLGPAEIVSGGRRAMSIGPSEIFGAVKSKQFGRQEMITPVQSRRKSCFMKLQNIDEEKVVSKERGKSLSLSPKSRKLAIKNQVSTRQAVTTIASKKVLKKEDSVISSVQPKKLFKDGEKSVPATNKKPLRPGRVVASRYNNQNMGQGSVMRKRSLLENDKDDRCDKKRSLSIGKSNVVSNESKDLGTEIRVKKRWEIPSEIVVHGSSVEDENLSPQSVAVTVAVVPDFLPRIKIARFVNETPRDSGPAKKVVELIGRKSFFAEDEVVETSVCQALTYADEEEEG